MNNVHVNNSAAASSKSSGIGFAGLLTILFIGLKLTGIISWSWLWVLSPIWITAALVFAIVGIIFSFALLVAAFTK